MEVTGASQMPKSEWPAPVGDGVSMACSPAPGLSPRHIKDNHMSSHPLDSTWQGLTRRVTFHEVSTCSEELCEQANNPFSIDLRLPAGSAVVPLCTSGRVLHGMFGVLSRLWQTKQVASPQEFDWGEKQSARWSGNLVRKLGTQPSGGSEKTAKRVVQGAVVGLRMPWPKTSRWTGCDTAEREGRVPLAWCGRLAKEQHCSGGKAEKPGQAAESYREVACQ